MSILDFAELGATLALRGFCRVGSSLSIFSHVRFGSSFSVLDNVGFGGTLSGPATKTDEITDLTSKTKMTLQASGFELSVNTGTRGLSVQHDSGTGYVTGYLHGTWHSDATITTSDRRLKTSIQPLYKTLQQQAKDKLDGSGKSVQGQEVNWLLRELRPVSFHLKRGPEAKHLKFGFIAQELESVFPNLVRKSGEDQTYSIATQDLIAVLTLAVQNLQKAVEESRDLLKQAQARHELEIGQLNQRVELLERRAFGARV